MLLSSKPDRKKAKRKLDISLLRNPQPELHFLIHYLVLVVKKTKFSVKHST